MPLNVATLKLFAKVVKFLQHFFGLGLKAGGPVVATGRSPYKKLVAMQGLNRRPCIVPVQGVALPR